MFIDNFNVCFLCDLKFRLKLDFFFIPYIDFLIKFIKYFSKRNLTEDISVLY